MTKSISNNEWHISQLNSNGETDVKSVDEVVVDNKEDKKGAAQLDVQNTVQAKTNAGEDDYLSVDLVETDVVETDVDETDVDETDTDSETEEEFEVGVDDFKSALLENKDLSSILEVIGVDEFLNIIDKDNSRTVTTEEIKALGKNAKSIADITLQDVLDFVKEEGLNLPSEEDIKDIDLTQKVFSEEIIRLLLEKAIDKDDKDQTEDSSSASDETYETSVDTPMAEAPAGSYPVSSGGSSGGYYGGSGGSYGGGTSAAKNTPVETAEEDKSLDELKNTVRPEKVKALQSAKDNMQLLSTDGGELAQYKEAMESAFENYTNSISEVDDELSKALSAKHKEILQQEKLISEKEAQIANQECTISKYETSLGNLNAKKASLVQNKAKLEALSAEEVKEGKESSLQGAIASLTQQIADIETQIKNTKDNLENAKTELNDMKTGKEDSLDSLQAGLKTLNSSEEGQLGDIQNKINNLIEANPQIKEYQDIYEKQKGIYESKKTELMKNAEAELKMAQEGINKTDGIINSKQIEEINKEFSTKKFTQAELFTDSKLTIQEVRNGETLPYVLIAPEGADPNEELPVLVYLHGSGQVGAGSLGALQRNQYDPAVIMQNWDLNNFNGYILCPLLDYGSWNTKHGEQEVRKLYDNFSSTHAVNKDKVAVAGASLGAQGTLYMANAMSDVFKRAAAFSPYNSGNLGGGMKIPTRAYIGTNDDPASKTFSNDVFRKLISEDDYFVLNGKTHNQCPAAAFMLDSNGDGCSDVLEWLFADE